MAKTAAEIMDRDFLYVSQADSILELLHAMSDRGLGSAPVLDLAGHPLGMATVGDLESAHRMEDVTRHLSRSALSIPQHTTIEAAARELAQRKADSLVLVDEHGIAVGALSALDLLRALLGFEGGAADGKKPPWSTGTLLDLDAVHHVPSAPGVIVLSTGNDARRPIWVEEVADLRERLDEMLRLPQHHPELEALLAVYPRTLRFRAIVVNDSERRQRLVRALRSIAARAARVKRGEAEPSDSERVGLG